MPDITLPTDAIPDCGDEQYVPQWRDDMLYEVEEEETVCAVQFPADASYISVGPYYPGGIYPVPQTEAERLESAKGALILGTVASADTCDIGSDWVLSFLDDILSAVGGTDYAYYPGAQPMLYFEDAAATIPATLNGVVGAMASADGAIIAVQATTGNKPFLRRTPTTGIYWLDSNTSTGALVATFGSSLGSACTIVRAELTGVTFQENVTIGTTHNIAPPFGFNSDVLIINRALTASEKALLTQYMSRAVESVAGPFLVRVVTRMNYYSSVDNWISGAFSGGTIAKDSEDNSIVMTVGSAQRAYVSTPAVKWVGGTTYVVTFDVDVAPSTDGIAYFGLPIQEGAQMINVPTTSGTRCGFIFTPVNSGTANLRLGLGVGGNMSSQTMTIHNPAIQVFSEYGDTFDGYGTGLELSTETPGYRFVSGSSGVIEPAQKIAIGYYFSKYSNMLAAGDSFANDGVDWPAQLRAIVGNAVTVNAEAGWKLTNKIVPAALTSVASGQYGAIAIQGGVNDASALIDQQDIRDAVTSLVIAARSKEMKVLIANISPWKGAAGWTAPKGSISDSYNTWLASGALGEDVEIVDIYSALDDPGNPGYILPAYDSGDGLHPNVAGMAVIAEAFKGAMNPEPIKWTPP